MRTQEQLEHRAGREGCRRARERTAQYFTECRRLGVQPEPRERIYLEALESAALDLAEPPTDAPLCPYSPARDYRAFYQRPDLPDLPVSISSKRTAERRATKHTANLEHRK